MSNFIINKDHYKSRLFPSLWSDKHYFLWHVSLHTPYDIGIFQNDWNTAAGISINGFSKSIQFKWRYEPDEYGFRLGVSFIPKDRDHNKFYQYPYIVRPKRDINFSIKYYAVQDEYVARIKGNGYYSETYKCSGFKKPKWGKYYFPSFGGNSFRPAPVDIRVEQTLIK